MTRQGLLGISFYGDFACFTRPEFRSERVSYEVLTPTAARGMIESIYWKPGIRWKIEAIDILRPIKFINITRQCEGNYGPALRNTLALKDVGYTVWVSGPQEGRLRRRVEEQKPFVQPVLGLRCFPAKFMLPYEEPIDLNLNLGLILSDFNYKTKQPTFSNSRIVSGRLVLDPQTG